jgi:hypothetical protein
MPIVIPKESAMHPNPKRIIPLIVILALAGGLAGMVGIAEVLGNAGKFRVGFSPDYGYIGIAVALLGVGSATTAALSGVSSMARLKLSKALDRFSLLLNFKPSLKALRASRGIFCSFSPALITPGLGSFE